MPGKRKAHAGEFSSTDWSLVGKAQRSELALSGPALEALLKCYYPVLLHFLTARKRIERHHAEDLLQGFISDKVLERSLVARADRSQGRFRSLLLKSLNNYVIDQFRRGQAAGKVVSLEVEGRDAVAANSGQEPDVFDATWARQVLIECFSRMKNQGLAEPGDRIWCVFQDRILNPLLSGVEPVPYTKLIERLKFESPAQATNALVTAKRRFRNCLETVILEYAGNEKEVQSEIAELQRILSATTAHDWGLIVVEVSNLTATDSPEIEQLASTSGISLGKLLDRSADRRERWSDDDLRALLEHQLSLPIPAPDKPKSGSAVMLVKPQSPHDAEISSLAELFGKADPPIHMLEEVKELCGSQTRSGGTQLTVDIAGVIYFACIAAALVRCGTSLSHSGSDVLSHGFGSMLQLPWLTDHLRSLFHDAQVFLVRDESAG